MPNLTISISDELYRRMERFRDRIDISRVCEKALAKETHRMERKLPTWPQGDVGMGGRGMAPGGGYIGGTGVDIGGGGGGF
jgi:post-segregation antitoxin (ccd killing protein)